MTRAIEPSRTAASDGIVLRPGRPDDIEPCAVLVHEAFGAINRRHGFPPETPTLDAARGLAAVVFGSRVVSPIVAHDADGRIVGVSALWDGGPIAGVGPVCVDPAAQARSIGKRLMLATLDLARERGVASVRLCQAAFNTISFSLYAKLGFDVCEPLVLMNASAPIEPTVIDGFHVRPATAGDLDACADVCCRIHGHDRTGELAGAVARGTARVVEHAGRITGYATDVGFMGHAVGLGNDELKALVGAARTITAAGVLIPSRNGELLRWCLSRGLRVVQPMTLMATGLYTKPRGAFIPSILY